MKSWVYESDGTTNLCGATTCAPYYSGCADGNKCNSGYCEVNPDAREVDSCNANLFTGYQCSGDPASCSASLADTDIDCSVAGAYDGDTIACNCDCDNYDIEEKIYSSLSFDGVDDYVTIPNDSSLNPEKITLEAWVYPTSFNYYGNIIDKRLSGDQYILRFYSTTEKIQGLIHDGSTCHCSVHGINYSSAGRD